MMIRNNSDIFYLVLCAASIVYVLYRLNKCVAYDREVKKQEEKE